LADVGKWLPWDPQPTKLRIRNMRNDELNTLMRKYKENEDNREKFFDERSKGATGASTKQVFDGSSRCSPSDTFGNV
jgi:hypothetical protein